MVGAGQETGQETGQAGDGQVATATSPVTELGPAPGHRALEVEVPCRGPGRRRGARHPVTIGPDWSVSTPHDLDQERAAVALGAPEPSCVGLVDRTVPALRDLLQVVGRRRPAPLARNHAGRWVVTQPTAGCSCGPGSFATAQEAAGHVRSASHLAPRYGADPVVLARLLEAAEAAHGGFATCPPEGWGALACVREVRGFDALWEAGVPPELLVAVQEAVLPRGAPLPAQAHLGAVYHCRDLGWLAATVARRPDPDVAVWAAWGYGEGDRTHPHLRGQWLAHGLPRATIGVLVDGAITVRLARELGEATGRTLGEAAELLAAWERAGCRPGPGDIAVLDAADGGRDYRPVPAAVSGLHLRAETLADRPTRTQVAVLLGLTGTRDEAWRLLRAGVRTPDQVRTRHPDSGGIR